VGVRSQISSLRLPVCVYVRREDYSLTKGLEVSFLTILYKSLGRAFADSECQWLVPRYSERRILTNYLHTIKEITKKGNKSIASVVVTEELLLLRPLGAIWRVNSVVD
jgi:hypothetical protein